MELGFRRLFARKATPEQDKTERRSRDRIPPSERDTVLIVDDSRTAVYVLKTMLEQSGFTTFSASDGESGIQAAKEKQPRLILMDVVMPGINGFQATRQLRQDPSTRDIPIILISGNQQVTEQVWGRRLGANDFLSKPIQRGLLFYKVETLLGLREPAPA